MKKERCNVEDVAIAAGVSSMTVSRAINGLPGVGAEVRQRVLETAAGLGYRPSRVARGLAGRKTSTLGIVLPDMANPFFAILAKAATDVARSADKNVFVMNTDESPALERAALASLASEAIDGVIVAGSRLPSAGLVAAVSRFDAAVLVNRNPAGPRVDAVNVDDRSGAVEAVAYLVAAGRRRVGFIAGPRASLSGRRRLAGYRWGLEAGGIRYDPALVERCVPTIDGGAEAVKSLLGRAASLDAILAYNDLAAIGALRALEDAGRAVPGDVAVIGADDVPYAALVRPALSTIRVDISALGRHAMSRLLALGEGRELEPAAAIVPELVLRESA
ncbi:MAG: LacI family DNA-binding transcriptional regulator [Rectinemataceae bacterium]|jgi:DNA-binding LacI/PurR family transcriptional regulator